MEEMINLDQCVIKALDLFSKTPLPKIKIHFKSPLIIGSGNAAALGKILFNGTHANESNYKKILKQNNADGAIIISASAGKHSPRIIKYLKKKKVSTILLTNNKEGKATKLADQTYIFPKNIEPYTYNTSTYLGMILSKTNENPRKISSYLKKIKIPNNLKKYNSYQIIIPERFDGIQEFYETKFEELFGPMIQGKSFTFEQEKHAKTIIETQKELFIGVGIQNKTFGKNRLNFKIPKSANFALMFCLGYYIIGKIQSQNPPWFKRNIKSYVKKASKLFKEKIKIQS